MKAHHCSLSAYYRKIMLVLARKSRSIIMFASDFSLLYFGRILRGLMRKTALNFRTGNHRRRERASRFEVRASSASAEKNMSKRISINHVFLFARALQNGLPWRIVYKRGTNRGNRLILSSG